MNTQTSLNLVSNTRCFNGQLRRYQHRSDVLNCEMTFSIYLPPQAETGKIPLLWWLSGLTCTDENFMQKAGAQRLAAALGIAIVCPDTSPRGVNLPGEDDSYDFGAGAGFYVNAKTEPWRKHYRMYDYINTELPGLLYSKNSVEGFVWSGKESISGHSMGGHGALVLALRNPGRFASVSAFAPIVNPMNCPWGEKAFKGYLGDDKTLWEKYDACALVAAGGSKQELLVEQGDADDFLNEQLKPEALQFACTEHKHPLILNRHKNYDHSYYFIASFIEPHFKYHAKYLGLV